MEHPNETVLRPNHEKSWPVMFYFFASPILTILFVTLDWAYRGFSLANVLLAVGMYLACGLSLTGGYHRYFSHRSYEAHRALQIFFIFFGAANFQNSLLFWTSNHRYHHRYTDTERDPYDITRGFFFAHMGWIFYKNPSDRPFDNVADLKRDPVIMWQERYYWYIVAVVGFGLPALIGALYGDALGGLLWGGLVRTVVGQHLTFLVNSYAHTFGHKTHSEKQSARDSWVLAFLTLGEGWHNFHHTFPSDYRNGAAWYQWDPTKWFVQGLSAVKLTSSLRRTART